jgi:hypothetical protein
MAYPPISPAPRSNRSSLNCPVFGVHSKTDQFFSGISSWVHIWEQDTPWDVKGETEKLSKDSTQKAAEESALLEVVN